MTKPSALPGVAHGNGCDGKVPSLSPACVPHPAKQVALRYVELLTGSPDTEIRLRFLGDAEELDPAERKGTINQLWPEIVDFQRQRYGVFLVVNEGQAKGKYICDNDITKTRACFIDNDGTPEPETWHLPPDFLVRTSPGKFHAYWVVVDLPVADFPHLQCQLAAFYGTDKSVINTSRIMRLAGTIHWKIPAEPHVVTLHE